MEQSGLNIKDGVLLGYSGPGGTVVVPDGVRAVAPKAFFNQKSLDEIWFPDTLEEIGKEAFWASGLKQIVIPESIRVIQREAFAYTPLEEVTMPVFLPDIQMGFAVFSCCRISRMTLTGEFRTPVQWESRKARMDFWYGIPGLCENISFFWAPQIRWSEISTMPRTAEFARVKDAVLSAFAEKELAGEFIPEEIREEYLKQLRERRKRIWMVPSVFRLLLDREYLRIGDLDAILTEADRRKDIAMKAELLDYQQRMFTQEQREREQERKWKRGLQIPARAVKKQPQDWRFCVTEWYGGCTITQYQGTETDVVVPDHFEGWPVVRISEDAFSVCRKNVPLEGEIRQVHENLRRVQIPSGMHWISKHTFAGCRALRQIQLPENLTCICEEAFLGCDNLTEIVLPSGVKQLSERCFGNCTRLKTVILPEGLESIGRGAFENCTSLQEIRFPASLKELGGKTCAGCTSLQKAVFAPGACVAIRKTCLKGCTALREVALPGRQAERLLLELVREHPEITLYVPRGSETEAYARERKISVTPV